MSEEIENTQQTSTPPEPAVDDTQPIKPIKKKSRWISILIGILGFLLLVGLGGFGGYQSGIKDRTEYQKSLLSKQLSEQFSYALVDLQFKRYDAAKQRLEFIISEDPTYPGAQEKLTEVMVLSVIPTATPPPTPTSTPDFSGAESAYQRAQQLVQAKDWPNALGALDTIRKLDPTYKTAQVDGMYYFALRNQGVALLTKEGNLEGGIYYLTLAERFGPLDTTSNQLREGARIYIIGASFWDLDWKQAYDYFKQANGSLWDGTMTGTQRLQTAAMRYGDTLFDQQNYCKADELYTEASGLGTLDKKASSNAYQAHQQCYPPTEAPTAPPAATAPPVATP